ncbi:DUF4136 domain-containing protein [Pseudomonas sp. TTU2014-080ASC]|uniref:DUF4136 domain-containing protein n=1 Tax=Pseudomonas sp. TTU2014-080ASC TaxID=1729724 RepID=UPI000718A0C1|nr:DUF4136 domain-containing protein [Pseudomonas sp. TTU2014-080ASC]KRW61661.1 hypothetical protein AO726_10150 [Pseudomonas sp. TTU2014-080ASC]
MKLLGALLLLISLTACQSQNPYVADGKPLPPPPAAVAHHVDRSAYPATPLDFARYRSWRWQQLPAATSWASSEEIQQAVSNALDQRDLRPQQSDAASDLLIKAELRQEQRLRQVVDDYGSYYGRGYYGPGHYGDRYGMWGSAPIVRTYREDVLVVRIEFYDSTTGQLVWSTSAESLADKDQRSQTLHQAVKLALDDYPPY